MGPPQARDEHGNSYVTIVSFGEKVESKLSLDAVFFNAESAIKHWWFNFLEMRRGNEDKELCWRMKPSLKTMRHDDKKTDLFMVYARLVFR